MQGSSSEETDTDAAVDISESTVEVPVGNTTKNSDPKFFKNILNYLDAGQHRHMLYYIPDSDDKLFEIIYMNQKNKKKWKTNYNSLFEDSYNFLKEEFNREPQTGIKELFRSNLYRCLNKYIKIISTEKDDKEKCRRVVRYKILRIPESCDVETTSNNKKVKRKHEKIEVNSPRKRRKMNTINKGKPPEESCVNRCLDDSNEIVPYEATPKKVVSNCLCLLTNPQILIINPVYPRLDLNNLNKWITPTLLLNGDITPNTDTNNLCMATTLASHESLSAAEVVPVNGNVIPNKSTNNLSIATAIATLGNSDATQVILVNSNNISNTGTNSLSIVKPVTASLGNSDSTGFILGNGDIISNTGTNSLSIVKPAIACLGNSDSTEFTPINGNIIPNVGTTILNIATPAIPTLGNSNITEVIPFYGNIPNADTDSLNMAMATLASLGKSDTTKVNEHNQENKDLGIGLDANEVDVLTDFDNLPDWELPELFNVPKSDQSSIIERPSNPSIMNGTVDAYMEESNLKDFIVAANKDSSYSIRESIGLSGETVNNTRDSHTEEFNFEEYMENISYLTQM